MNRPLEGITVVALEQAVAAPFATRQLADLGARVIKIERPLVGDFGRAYDTTVQGLSAHFVWLNRSKESLTLDIKHPDAQPILQRLLAQADVFIQNLAPGATERLGLDAATLTAAYPQLIVCDISGYGSSGSYRHKKAYDLLVQCETGVVSITGTPEAPAKTGIAVADIAAGMYAFSGILTALYQRQQTQRGTAFEVSLFESLGEWMGFPAYYTAYGGFPPPRSGTSHAAIAPYGPFMCGDGKTVFLSIQNSREWERFCRHILYQPELIADPRFSTVVLRVHNRQALDAIINATFATRNAEQIVALLDEVGIANARLNDVQEFWDHPQLQERNRWRDVETETGTIKALIPPTTFADFAPRMDAVPALGAHTDALLSELGFDRAERGDLQQRGVV